MGKKACRSASLFGHIWRIRQDSNLRRFREPAFQASALGHSATNPYGGKCEIRTHGSFRSAGFQDQCIRPLCQLSLLSSLQFYSLWQGRRASNPQPSVLETDALPIELRPSCFYLLLTSYFLEEAVRFELTRGSRPYLFSRQAPSATRPRFHYWQGRRVSNPHLRFWRPLLCRLNYPPFVSLLFFSSFTVDNFPRHSSWCPRRESNARPLPYQGSALPLSHWGDIIAKLYFPYFSPRCASLLIRHNP